MIYLPREGLWREHALLFRLSARFSCRKQNVLGASKGRPLVEHWSPENREFARAEHSRLTEPEERLTFMLHGIVAYAVPWWSAAGFQTQTYRPQHSSNFPTSAHNGLRLSVDTAAALSLAVDIKLHDTVPACGACACLVQDTRTCRMARARAWHTLQLVSRRPHQRSCHEGRFPYSSAIEGFCLLCAIVSLQEHM